MTNYNYQSLNQKGKIIKGSMNANNIEDLEQRLEEIGLEIIKCKEDTKWNFSFRTKITTRDLILICTHFEQLDKVGISIIKIISDLKDSSENITLKDLMQDVLDSVKAGDLLSEAFAKHPKIFDDVFVGLVNAGEKTGSLSQSFNYLAEHLKWSSEIKRQTKKAIRYPIFLICVLFVVIFVMMNVVIPKLSEFLLQQNFELPFYTNALISSSEFFVNHWIWIVLVPIIILILHKIIIKTNESYELFFNRLLLSLPFLGKIMLKLDISRFSQFFLITFKSGIEIRECFSIVEKVVNNKVIKKIIAEIKDDISEGKSISLAIKQANVFPSLVVRMFEVGEATGNMQESLENIKFFYDKEVNDGVDALVGIIQPALTIIMGAVLLWISLAVFGPLYSSFGNIK